MKSLREFPSTLFDIVKLTAAKTTPNLCIWDMTLGNCKILLHYIDLPKSWMLLANNL